RPTTPSRTARASLFRNPRSAFRTQKGMSMRRSTDRILVSHAGNLPRPDSLNELIDGGRARERSLGTEYHDRLPQAVQWIVGRQIELGVDIVNDGEYIKAGSYGGYIHHRGSGFQLVPAGSRRPRKPPRRGER